MVDTMMIARIGETAVGAVGLCSQFSVLMLGCYWGFVGGGMLFISQYWGAQDEEGICRSYGLMLCCIMSVAAIFASAALFAPQVIMRLAPASATAAKWNSPPRRPSARRR